MNASFTKRTDLDFLQRSLPGVLLYAITWPILSWSTDFHQLAPTFSNTFAALFIGLSVLRFLHAGVTPKFYARSPNAWRFVLFALAYGHAATLSALFICLLANPAYYHMVIPGAILITGLVSGSAASLAPKPVFTQFYISLLIGPSIAAVIFTEQFQYLIPLYIILWLYFILMGYRYYREYERAYIGEMKLKDNQVKLEKLNKTDTLTGIFNRQYFDEALDLQWELAARSQTHLAILFLDLDYFKKVNDQYGHIVGDKALCHAAHVFKEIAKRKSDMLARYGGEEFAIILPGSNLDEAQQLAESIREHLEKTPLIIGEQSIHLTTSIGVNSTIPNNLKSSIGFLDDADKALFQAMDLGRNQVMAFQ